MTKHLPYWLGHALLLIGLSSALAAEPESRKKIVVVHGTQESYKEAATSLKAGLDTRNADSVAFELPAELDDDARAALIEKIREEKPDVVATGGLEATLIVLEEMPGTPVTYFMVPNARDVLPNASPDQANGLPGVTSDISPADWISWIRELQPDGKKVGLLFSERTRLTATAIVDAARERNLNVQLIEADGDNFPKAIDALTSASCDSVLMIPDAKVYNGPNIQRLLLWGVRTKTPVWAFSPKIVKAGAPSGQYASSEDIGRQTAELVWKVCTDPAQAATGIQYPEKASRALNERTAEMVGLKISDRTREKVSDRYGAEQ